VTTVKYMSLNSLEINLQILQKHQAFLNIWTVSFSKIRRWRFELFETKSKRLSPYFNFATLFDSSLTLFLSLFAHIFPTQKLLHMHRLFNYNQMSPFIFRWFCKVHWATYDVLQKPYPAFKSQLHKNSLIGTKKICLSLDMHCLLQKIGIVYNKVYINELKLTHCY